jgi:hypothetical protein
MSTELESRPLFEHLFKRIGFAPGVHPAHLEVVTGFGIFETEIESGISGNGGTAIYQQHVFAVVREGDLLNVVSGHEFTRVRIFTGPCLHRMHDQALDPGQAILDSDLNFDFSGHMIHLPSGTAAEGDFHRG